MSPLSALFSAKAAKIPPRRYQGKFVESNFYHYEFLGEHFKTRVGYNFTDSSDELTNLNYESR
jgi:hypothetical protein